jgi:hypothetical protein
LAAGNADEKCREDSQHESVEGDTFDPI